MPKQPNSPPRSELVRILENAEAAKKVLSEPSNLLTQEKVIVRVISQFMEPIQLALENEPEFIARPKMMLSLDSGALGFSPPMAAQILLNTALRNGVPQAIDFLNYALSADEVKGYRCLLVKGIEIKNSVNFGNGVKLIPISELPPSSQKTRLKNEGGLHPFGRGPIMPWDQPLAALIADVTLSSLIVDENAPPITHDTRLEAHFLLQEICRCLTLIGPSAPIPDVEWFQYKDEQLAFLSAYSGIMFFGTQEIATFFPRKPELLDFENSINFIPKYLGLKGHLKDKIRLSLDRFNQSMRRRDVGDKALDLAIALEVLLGGDDKTELSWRISFRAALIGGGDINTRKRTRAIVLALYNLRSSVVHNGKAEQKIRVKGLGKLLSNAVVEEAAKICASIIRNIIQNKIPENWNEFELAVVN